MALRYGLADRGVLVMDLAQRGPAAAAGVKPGDLLVRLGATAILGNDDLVRALNAETVGKTMELAMLREGELRVLSVTPAERPSTA
jgi:S1-C subfamily serine protease